jgi:uncharacterized protein (TIGR03437 family)
MTYFFALLLITFTCAAQTRSVIVLPAAGDRTATIVDQETWKQIGSTTVGAQSFSAVTLPNGSKTYVLAKSCITVLGELAKGGEVLATLELAVSDAALSSNGRRLLVVSLSDPALTIINTATDRIMARIPLPRPASSISINHSTTQAVAGTAGAVSFIDLNTNSLTLAVPVPKTSYAAFAPNGSVYAVAGDTLVEIDQSTRTIVASVTARSALGTPRFTANAGHALMLASDGLWVAGLAPLRIAGPFVAPSPIDEVRIVSDRIAIGYSSSARAFFRIEFQPAVVITPLTGLPGDAFAGMSSTQEDPESRHLIVANGNEVLRTDARGRVNARLALSRPAGPVIVPPLPSRAPVARVSVVEGRRSRDLPVVFRMLDADGLPVTNRTVSFSTGCGDAGYLWEAFTTAHGYVETGRVRPGGCWGLGAQGDRSWTVERLPFESQRQATAVIHASPATMLVEAGGEPPLLRVRPVDQYANPALQTLFVSSAMAKGSGQLQVDTRPDYRGFATNRFQPTALAPGMEQTQSVVTARGLVGEPISFTVVTLAAPPLITRLSAPIKASAGHTVEGALRYRVTDRSGAGVEGIGLTLGSDSDWNAVKCANAAVTNGSGVVSCDLFVGTGASTAKVYLGGREIEKPPITITPAAPAIIVPVSGHVSRFRNSYSNVLDPANAIITDQFGNPVNGIRPTWSPGAMPLAPEVSSTKRYLVGDMLQESDGLVSARFAGSAREITAEIKDAEALFSAAVPESVRILDGDRQAALVGQPFDRPLLVEAGDSGFTRSLLHNVSIQFQPDEGLTLSSLTGVTDSQGHAEVSVMGSSRPGVHHVIASINGISATFQLTVVARAAITNGASFVPGLAPCAVGHIAGSSLPSTLLSIGGLTPAIFYTNDDAISFQVPCELAPGPAEVKLGTFTQTVTIAPYAPGIFENAGKAVAVRPDGTYVSATNPAERGEEIRLFVTGLGHATPVLKTGVPGNGERVNAKVIVGLGAEGIDAEAVYAPTLTGTYIVKFRIPANSTSNAIGVAVQAPDGSFVHSKPSLIDVR